MEDKILSLSKKELKKQISENFLKTIENYMKLHELTQTQLEKKVKLSHKSLWSYKETDSCPSILTLVKVSTILNIPIDELISLKVKKNQTSTINLSEFSIQELYNLLLLIVKELKER